MKNFINKNKVCIFVKRLILSVGKGINFIEIYTLLNLSYYQPPIKIIFLGYI